MDLDRGTLARIDRKLLAGLNQDETFRMVRVPVTSAKWFTWKRYCDAAGISMGRAIVALIEHELMGAFGEPTGDQTPVFAGLAEEQLAAREAQRATRERGLDAVEERLRRWTERLRLAEAEIEARKRRVELASKLVARPKALVRRPGGMGGARADQASSTSTATGGEEVPLRRMSGVGISGS